MNDQFLLFVCTFGAVATLAFFASRFMLQNEDRKLRDRLAGDNPRQRREKVTATSLLQAAGQFASRPFMPKSREKQSALRRRLGQAGLYAPSAARVVTGCKFILLATGAAAGYLIGAAFGNPLIGLSCGGLVGYILPILWLRAQIQQNQKALAYGLADALDLMVICVEAGLTVDSAVQRVGQELALAHPVLSRELEITHMETRVGLSRAEALRNLGHRTGSPALQSLVAMLVQADRFGTSIASALRVHADSLRSSRQHAAEEMAAKASVKMSFPLVLCIFPATFITLAGPTVIRLLEIFK